MRKCPNCGNDNQKTIHAVVLEVTQYDDELYIDAGIGCDVCNHTWQAVEVEIVEYPDDYDYCNDC